MVVLMLRELGGGRSFTMGKKGSRNLGEMYKVYVSVALSLSFIIERSERTWLVMKSP